jgi:hypothetical protein
MLDRHFREAYQQLYTEGREADIANLFELREKFQRREEEKEPTREGEPPGLRSGVQCIAYTERTPYGHLIEALIVRRERLLLERPRTVLGSLIPLEGGCRLYFSLNGKNSFLLSGCIKETIESPWGPAFEVEREGLKHLWTAPRLFVCKDGEKISCHIGGGTLRADNLSLDACSIHAADPALLPDSGKALKISLGLPTKGKPSEVSLDAIVQRKNTGRGCYGRLVFPSPSQAAKNAIQALIYGY